MHGPEKKAVHSASCIALGCLPGLPLCRNGVGWRWGWQHLRGQAEGPDAASGVCAVELLEEGPVRRVVVPSGPGVPRPRSPLVYTVVCYTGARYIAVPLAGAESDSDYQNQIQTEHW